MVYPWVHCAGLALRRLVDQFDRALGMLSYIHAEICDRRGLDPPTQRGRHRLVDKDSLAQMEKAHKKAEDKKRKRKEKKREKKRAKKQKKRAKKKGKYDTSSSSSSTSSATSSSSVGSEDERKVVVCALPSVRTMHR